MTFAFFVTWIVLFFLTYSTYSCFIKLTLMDCSRLPERATIVIHVRFDKRYHQIPTKLKAFCTCISCIHCIYCLTMDSARIKDISLCEKCPFPWLLLPSKRAHSLIRYADTTFIKIVYFICACFFFSSLVNELLWLHVRGALFTMPSI